jgi:hypothetical protein
MCNVGCGNEELGPRTHLLAIRVLALLQFVLVVRQLLHLEGNRIQGLEFSLRQSPGSSSIWSLGFGVERQTASHSSWGSGFQLEGLGFRV